MPSAAVDSQVAEIQYQISNTNIHLSAVNNELEEVRKAKREIDELKDRADELRIVLRNVDCENSYYWRGVQWDRFDEHYDQGKTDVKIYYNCLEVLEDDLDNATRKLINEHISLTGYIAQLNNSLQNL